ncbi:hypothetical protein B9Z43_01265 [Limnohabitans sp. MMS-10A-192]|uniref:YdaU family protein n=1 Tax=Limnohabitans sp. MMS-10A-192 TaxID=1835769 RepID=UPI000D34B366|nr:YdaU family protein [Limnohabitans sp. MMS-10A-192]PUE21840.1 hypothetical protein B9Z43_01265 [Limnohabitans sp. MMS-10A-192]
MNYYPFHVGDYLTHTAHLSPLEDIAYRRLLDLYYISEEMLPADPAACARKIRMREYQAEVQQVLEEFFEPCAEGWRSRRCDEEIAAMREKQEKARASAAASVAARRAKAEPAQTDRKATDERTLNERSTDVQLPTPTPIPTPCSESKDSDRKPGKRAAIDKPEGITQEVWDGFLAIRKAKKAPLTAAALEGIKREATKAGIDLQEALQVCCTRGWQGFNAEWIGGSTQAAAGKAPARTSRHSGFEKINYREGINADGTFA